MLKPIVRAATVTTAVILLTGCGGSSTAANTGTGGNGTVGGTSGGTGGTGGTGGNPPETIQGVATPSSVAVVTATNAN
jgi:hypothetical protein